MGVEKTININSENSTSLKEILGDDGKEDYEHIKACVEVYLLSKFKERRNLALLKLQNYFNPSTEVHKVIEGETISLYISPTKDKDAFLFVERYINTAPDTSLEPELTDKERIVGNRIFNN
jgi:hypothetical protein